MFEYQSECLDCGHTKWRDHQREYCSKCGSNNVELKDSRDVKPDEEGDRDDC